MKINDLPTIAIVTGFVMLVFSIIILMLVSNDPNYGDNYHQAFIESCGGAENVMAVDWIAEKIGDKYYSVPVYGCYIERHYDEL